MATTSGIALTIPTIAKRISLSEQLIARKIRAGEIEASKQGRDWLIPSQEAERLERLYPLEAD
jgi:excisionase family DNA binding protein